MHTNKNTARLRFYSCLFVFIRGLILLFVSNLFLFAQADKGLVAGKVLNSATGGPVRKAHVSIFGGNQKPESGGSAITDAAGSFEIGDLPAGDYSLVVAREGFVPPNVNGKIKRQRVTLAAAEEKREVIVRLTPLTVIAGRILDEDGDPIQRVEVQAMDYQYTASGRQLSTRGSATTNDLGEYRIFDLNPGRYYVKAGSTGMMYRSDESFAPAYYPGTADASAATAVEAAAGQTAQGIDVTLHATRLAHIRGRVMNPGSNLTVGLIEVGERGGTSTTSIDDPKGKFELRGVLPGSYILIAHGTIAEQHFGAHLPIQVGSADLEGIELHLLPPVEIAGQIRMEGKTGAKMSRLNVQLQEEGHAGQSIAEGEPKEDGSFVLEGVEPGVYHVSVSAPEELYLKAVRWSDRDVMQSGLDLTQGAAGSGLVVVMSANGGQIDGVVEDDQSAPMAGATVALVPADAKRPKALFKAALTGPNGHFRIPGIAPGSYKLFAFEDADSNRVMYDSDFWRPFDSQGQSMEISEGGKESVQLKAIKPTGEQPPAP